LRFGGLSGGHTGTILELKVLQNGRSTNIPNLKGKSPKLKKLQKGNKWKRRKKDKTKLNMEVGA